MMKALNRDRLLLLLKSILLVIGVWVGWNQLWIATKAIFVFRNDEPALSWVFVLSGPLSVLPASFLAVFEPKYGVPWLVLGSLISSIAIAVAIYIEEGMLSSAIYPIAHYSLPMFALGIFALFIWKLGKNRVVHAIRKDGVQ